MTNTKASQQNTQEESERKLHEAIGMAASHRSQRCEFEVGTSSTHALRSHVLFSKGKAQREVQSIKSTDAHQKVDHEETMSERVEGAWISKHGPTA